MRRPARTRPALAEQIRDTLADRIAAGKYPPGSRLVELHLAKEFGTSQAPVREALRMLEGLRLVESARHRGTHVRHVTDQDVRESNLVRAVLEEAAAWDAAEYYAHHPEAIDELRAATDRMAAAAEAEDLGEMQANNVVFHRAIVVASGNRILRETWESMALRPMGVFTYLRKGYHLGIGVAQHRWIIEALVAGDGPEAGRRLREHALHFARLHAAGAGDQGGSGSSA
jgi:DNA-binding GntR family transcriptional regulator